VSTAPSLVVEIAPVAPPQPTSALGVCISGGGSRSLSLAVGQLRALSALGVLDQVSYVSGVSGGSWATVAYTYLPSSFDETSFLGVPVPPQQITLAGLATLPVGNLGVVPQRLSWDRIFWTVA